MENIIHNLEEKSENNKISLPYFLIITIFFVFLGVTLGFYISKLPTSKNKDIKQIKNEKIVGINDKKTFKDKAEGILKEGGIDGEGNFHLERPGGESQNVYLTSTAVDLSLYVGKKVRVWGKTFSGEKAGWFMDVGLIEVLE